MPNMPSDGNAVAGVLADLFVPEMTTAITTCSNCGNVAAIGELLAYLQAPGVVVRCRNCGAVQLRVVRAQNRAWVDMRGTQVVEMTLEGDLEPSA
jgi:hypothetical protein